MSALISFCGFAHTSVSEAIERSHEERVEGHEHLAFKTCQRPPIILRFPDGDDKNFR